MSIKAMTWAMQEAPVDKSGPAHVLLVLADHAGDDGRGAFPSVDTIVWKTRLSERSVQTHLRTLEKEGLIRKGNQALAAHYIEREDKRPTVYDLDLTRSRGPRPVRGAKSAPRTSAEGSNGVQISQERGAKSAPEPSLETVLVNTYPPTPQSETTEVADAPVSDSVVEGDLLHLVEDKDKGAAAEGAASWPDSSADCGPEVPEWEDLAEEGQLTLPVAAEVLLHHAQLPVNDISTARVLKWFMPQDEDFLVPILADSEAMKPLPNMNLSVLRGRVRFLRNKYELTESITPVRARRTS
jgi:hypothetical protein